MSNKLAAIAAELHGDLRAMGFPDQEINGAELITVMADYYAHLDRAVNGALGRNAPRQEPLTLD